MTAEDCPAPRAGCPVRERVTGCFTDEHHLYWPRVEYQTKIEREFRNLGQNVVEICRREHEIEHALNEPPEKPSTEEMIDEIEQSDQHISCRLQQEIEEFRNE